MSYVFEFIAEGTDKDTEYRFTFFCPDELEFLQVSTCSAKPRLWTMIPNQIAQDLPMYDEAFAAAEVHYASLDTEEEECSTRWDNARITRGIRGH